MGPDPRPVTRLDRTRRVVRVGDSDDPNERRRRFRPCVRASVRACVGASVRSRERAPSFVRPRRSSGRIVRIVRSHRPSGTIDRSTDRSIALGSVVVVVSFPSRAPTRGRRRERSEHYDDANGRASAPATGDRRGNANPTTRGVGRVHGVEKENRARARKRLCASIHPAVRSFVSGRESGREKKKRSTHLRGDRAADGLLRRRRALGEREEAGVQSEGNHDYLRSCVDRSAGRSRDARLGTDAIIGVGSVEFSTRATLRDVVYQ